MASASIKASSSLNGMRTLPQLTKKVMTSTALREGQSQHTSTPLLQKINEKQTTELHQSGVGQNETMGAVLTRLLEVFYTKKLDIVVIGLENRYASSCGIPVRQGEERPMHAA